MLDWSGAPALLCSTWADWGRGASWRRSMPRHPRNANGRWDGARGPEWSSVRARRASRRAAAGASRSTRIAAQRPTDSSTWRTCRRSGWGCTSACRRLFGGLLPRELPQHVLEDPAVAVVLELLWGVDPHDRTELERRPVGSGRLHRKRFAVREPPREHGTEPGDFGTLAAGEPVRCDALVVQDMHRHAAHPDEVRSVDALVALGARDAHAEQARALRRPAA